MNKTNILSFTVGLLVSILLWLAAFLLIFIYSFDVFGLRQARDPEGFDAQIFYSVLMVGALNCFISFLLFKRRRRFTSIGGSLPIVFVLIFLGFIGFRYFDKSTYYEDFDGTRWSATENRLKMARKLVKDDRLIGMRKDEIIEKLGQGYESTVNDKQVLTYNIDGDWIKLALTFQSNKVEQSDVWVYD